MFQHGSSNPIRGSLVINDLFSNYQMYKTLIINRRLNTSKVRNSDKIQPDSAIVKMINSEYKRIITQRYNYRSTRQIPSFSGKDHLKILLIPNGADSHPDST